MYRELAPPPALRDVVACLWVRTPDGRPELRVVPDGCADVIWRRGFGTSVAGPDTTAQVTELGAEDVLVGMRFLPGAGGGALGMPLDELRDLRVDVADVDRAFALDPDLAPQQAAKRLVRAVADRRGDPLVAEVVRRLDGREVGAVAREVGLSERQLRRRFHAAVGYGPKTLARVLRFQRFVAAVDGGRSDLAAIALDAGYADQAHLTRECTRLAGLPPTGFIRARSA